MTRIIAIENGKPVVRDDAWHVERNAEIDIATLPAGPVLVPLALWQAQHAALAGRGPANIGVWLAPDSDLYALEGQLEQLGCVGVDFPTFKDGRGYSIATLLRTRLRWNGPLLAIGDVLHDQLAFMKRCGFDRFALRADLDAEYSLRAFTEINVKYQATFDEPLPLFRRRELLQQGESA